MVHGAKGKGQSVTKLIEINPYLSQRKHPPKADIAQREGVLRDTERSVSSVRISFAKARGNFFYKNDFYQNGHALKRDPVYHSITPSLHHSMLHASHLTIIASISFSLTSRLNAGIMSDFTFSYFVSSASIRCAISSFTANA